MISPEQMAAMRTTLDTSLPDMCQLVTMIREPDGSGGWIDMSVTAPVACRISPLATAGRDFESLDSDFVVSSVPWVGTFPAGTVIGPSDRFYHHDETYEVIASSSGRTWEIDVRVVCRLVA